MVLLLFKTCTEAKMWLWTRTGEFWSSRNPCAKGKGTTDGHQEGAGGSRKENSAGKCISPELKVDGSLEVDLD